MKLLFACALLLVMSCKTTRNFHLITPEPGHTLTGSEFYAKVAAYNWQQRDSFALKEILSGNMPSFLKKFTKINTSVTDSATGKIIHAYYFVSPDYLGIGNDTDWARVPLTPMGSQMICDSFHCFLPTRKIVNDIYRAATVRLEPVPMYAFRDSTVTMWQHHLIIEGQRKGKEGLIAGIKKDVVISGNIPRAPKADRVAIYGWHKRDGKPIQPLYTGHVNWYVDYSHGTRLVYRVIYVDGKAMDYIDVLQHPVYRRLVCDEAFCDCFRY